MASSIPAATPELINQMVLANRILYRYGVVDGYGHVSVRHDRSDQHFLLSVSKAPGIIEAADIRSHDMSGKLLGEGSPYLERFIHSEIYKSRPDVQAVVHSHAQGSVVFGITGQMLRPVFHMSGFLGSGSRLFEIADAAGDTDMLVSSPYLGDALAKALGNGTCALMRGHGMTVVGSTLPEAVFRAIYAENNAQMQLQAAALGQARYLSAGEAELSRINVAKGIDRTWNIWVRDVQDQPGVR